MEVQAKPEKTEHNLLPSLTEIYEIKKWGNKKEGGRGFVWRQPRQYEKEKSVIKGSTLCTSNNILIFCGHSVTSI